MGNWKISIVTMVSIIALHQIASAQGSAVHHRGHHHHEHVRAHSESGIGDQGLQSFEHEQAPEPVDGEITKTPCEILKEKKEASKEEGDESSLYGAVGCHDGKPLICVYPDAFIQSGDDPHGAAIISACISAHEHKHGEQAECNPDGKGVYPPKNDLKCDESESEALSTEIECYDSQKCPEGEAGKACRELVDSLKTEACDQYKERAGEAHQDC